MATVVTINSTDYSGQALVGAIAIEERLGSRAACRCEVRNTTDVISPMADLTITVDGTDYFGGIVLGVEESPLIDNRGRKSVLTATDYQHYADRLIANVTWPASTVLSTIVDDLCDDYLTPHTGVVMDPAIPTGANDYTLTEALTAEYVPVTDVLNLLARTSARPWRIYKSGGNTYLTFDLPTAKTFPGTITLGATHVLTNVSVTRQLIDFCDAVQVLYKGPALASYYYGGPPGGGTAYGKWERFVNAPEVETETDALAVAHQIVAQYGYCPTVLRVTTRTLGFHPGQFGQVSLTLSGSRTISGWMMVQAATYRHVPVSQAGTADAGSWFCDLELIADTDNMAANTNPKPGGQNWVDQWQGLISGASASSGQSLVSIPGATVINTVASFMDFQIPLGGSRTVSQQQAGTPWLTVPDAVEAVLDATKYAGVQVRARVWVKTDDAGTSVTPRIYDIDASSAVGTGSAATNTTWGAPQEFSITPTSGTHRYRLEIQPSNGSAAVYAIGVLYV